MSSSPSSWSARSHLHCPKPRETCRNRSTSPSQFVGEEGAGQSYLRALEMTTGKVVRPWNTSEYFIAARIVLEGTSLQHLVRPSRRGPYAVQGPCRVLDVIGSFLR